MDLDLKKLFVWNLNWSLRGRDLKEVFSDYDAVFATVIIDRNTGKSKWFGFVEFQTEEGAAKAKEELDWAEVEWRPIKIEYAKLRS